MGYDNYILSIIWNSGGTCPHSVKTKNMTVLCAVPNSVWAEAQQSVCISANRRSQPTLEERSSSGYE